MTKSEFRKLGVKVIDSINHELRSNKRNEFRFEEEADYASGRLGGFYYSHPNFTLCIQVFVNHENPDYICTTAVFPLPEDFMQTYPELNRANDELCGVKVTYSEEYNGLALICEIDTSNIENDNYGKFIINGVGSVVRNLTKSLKENLLKGISASLREIL